MEELVGEEREECIELMCRLADLANALMIEGYNPALIKDSIATYLIMAVLHDSLEPAYWENVKKTMEVMYWDMRQKYVKTKEARDACM